MFFALLSAFFFGVSNSYWKIAEKEIELPYLIFFRGLIVVIVLAFTWFFLAMFPISQIDLICFDIPFYNLAITALLCFFSSFGLVFFLQSLKYSPVSILAPISSVNIFGILTAVIFLKEVFLNVYYISVLFSIVGLLFLLKKRNFEGIALGWNKGATYSLIASFFWGVSYALFKQFISMLGVIPFAFVLEFSVLIISFLWIVRSKKIFYLRNQFIKKHIKHYLVLSVLLLGGTLFYNLALLNNTALEMNLINPVQVVVTIFAGLIILKEKLFLNQIIGIFLIVCSLLVIAFSK